ncbi:hypothetical protein ACP70R_037542 [Stipagrostis hirtigluma subsp. patula]
MSSSTSPGSGSPRTASPPDRCEDVDATLTPAAAARTTGSFHPITPPGQIEWYPRIPIICQITALRTATITASESYDSDNLRTAPAAKSKKKVCSVLDQILQQQKEANNRLLSLESAVTKPIHRPEVTSKETRKP